PRQVELQNGQRLPQFIVNLASQTRPFLFTNRFLTSRKLTQLLAGAAQHFFSPLVFGNLPDHHSTSRRRRLLSWAEDETEPGFVVVCAIDLTGGALLLRESPVDTFCH